MTCQSLLYTTTGLSHKQKSAENRSLLFSAGSLLHKQQITKCSRVRITQHIPRSYRTTTAQTNTTLENITQLHNHVIRLRFINDTRDASGGPWPRGDDTFLYKQTVYLRLRSSFCFLVLTAVDVHNYVRGYFVHRQYIFSAHVCFVIKSFLLLGKQNLLMHCIGIIIGKNNVLVQIYDKRTDLICTGILKLTCPSCDA